MAQNIGMESPAERYPGGPQYLDTAFLFGFDVKYGKKQRFRK